ncbi:MAG: FAD-dependent oxidoreductase [Bacilli bacterium]|nr:FAD-dependent oxidoreductase [Bacilli bacterium]
MKNISIWKDIESKSYPTLDEDKEVDVLIIGGGITGISSLYHLKDSNLKVMLVEQNKIGYGVTGNSTGKLNYLQNDLIDKIRKSFNDDTASKYLKSQIDAINMVVDIINKEKIDCDLVKVKGILYTNKVNEIKKIKDLELFLKENNIEVNTTYNKLVQSKYMIEVDNTYLFHPLKFIYGLLKNNKYPIYENTSIKALEKKKDYFISYTDKYKIKSKYVILALHYPYFNLPYLFPIKGTLEKSYLSASKYSGNDVSIISYSNPFISIRTYQDKLIYLSNSHSTSNNVSDKHHFEELIKKLNGLKLKPNYLWSNIDIITNDGLPYIGEIKNNLLIGTGYNTWGLATSVLSSKILSDIILVKDNEYVKLFDPKRVNISQVTGSLKCAYSSFEGIVNGLADKNEKVTYDEVDGKDVMIYRDSRKHIVNHKCPHFGCRLIFNEIEKTWDCPCHGSRFDIDGKCINGPSNHDIGI